MTFYIFHIFCFKVLVPGKISNPDHVADQTLHFIEIEVLANITGPKPFFFIYIEDTTTKQGKINKSD